VYKSHGLTGELTRPDWPPLTLAEVDRLLRSFPQAAGAVRMVSHSPRPFSSGSVVETRGEPVFVKRHARSVRERAGLLEEHRLISHLAHEIPDLVRPPLADRDGETVVGAGDWTYEVHPLARGLDVYEDALSWTPFHSCGHARAAGRAMARMHLAAASYDAPVRASAQLISSYTVFAENKPGSRLAGYLEKRPNLQNYAEARDWPEALHGLLMPFYRKLEPWLGHLTPLWTHNDWHASNLMWSGPDAEASVTGIIDFGLADRTNAVHDLATAIERNCIAWLRMEDTRAQIVHLDQLDAMLDGYEELSPLSYEQGRALAAILPLVHCEFALSETDYFLSVLHSPEKAYFAYEGYFLGHAEWFLQEQGRQLIDHLEERAERKRRS
jgi:Ser/Thr protein kinase RdoA (MazF antagonist)